MLSRLAKLAARAYHPGTSADELCFATAADGWRLALHHYLPRGASAPAQTTKRLPVILCHGLAANHFGFDLAPEVSLARRLASLGHDVYALELRGHGDSDAATFRGERRWGFSFDDYLRLDLPAAIDRVRELAGAPKVHWIGHSMGGILLYAYLATTGGVGLASGTAIGSSLDYSGSPSGFHGALRLRPMGRFVPAVPLGGLIRMTTPFSGRLGTALERFNFWPTNVDGAIVRMLHASTFHSVSTPVLLQLATAFEPGGLRSWDGQRRYLDDLRAAAPTVPVLALAADKDEQCPPGATEATLAALPAGVAHLVQFGDAHGHGSHYGHFDLVIGRRAAHEVWPVIERFLATGSPSRSDAR